jgi:hypothetical protein
VRWGDALEFISPAGGVKAAGAPVSVSPTGTEALRSSVLVPPGGGSSSSRYYSRAASASSSSTLLRTYVAPRFVVDHAPRCGGAVCATSVPNSAPAVGAGEITVALLAATHGAGVSGGGGGGGGGAVGVHLRGKLWSRGGASRVSLRSVTAVPPGRAWSSWRVPATVGTSGGRAGWATLFVSLGGNEVHADVLVFASPDTRRATPGVVPLGGGGLLWLVGADMRSGATGEGLANGGGGGLACALGSGGSGGASGGERGGGGGGLGVLVAVSSTLAVCETPALSQQAAAAPVSAFAVSGPTAAAAAFSGDAASAVTAAVAVLKPTTATGVSPPAAAADGGTVLSVSLSRDPGAALFATLGCKVGTLGPVPGHSLAGPDHGGVLQVESS